MRESTSRKGRCQTRPASSSRWHDLIGVTVDTAGSGHKAAELESVDPVWSVAS